MVTRCKFRGRLKVDGGLARSIDFEVANLLVHKKIRRNVDFEATKYENWRKSRTKCPFSCSYVSHLESGFPVASPCFWGKLQNLSFSKVSKQVVMSFCLAGVTLCDIPQPV